MLGRIASEFVRTQPADAAQVLERMPAAIVGEALASLPAPTAADVLQALTPHAAAGCLSEFPPATAAEIMRHVPTGRAAALLLRLDGDKRRKLMQALPPRMSAPLRLLLRFPPGSVGSLLDPQVLTVRRETRVREAADMARDAPSQLYKYLYVIDDDHCLTGVVTARQCLAEDPETRIGRFEHRNPVALRARSSLREASRNPGWKRFGVLPATDRRGVFLGVVRKENLRAALIEETAAEPEAGPVGMALELADLCWQTAAGLLGGSAPATGSFEPEARDS